MEVKVRRTGRVYLRVLNPPATLSHTEPHLWFTFFLSVFRILLQRQTKKAKNCLVELCLSNGGVPVVVWPSKLPLGASKRSTILSRPLINVENAWKPLTSSQSFRNMRQGKRFLSQHFIGGGVGYFPMWHFFHSLFHISPWMFMTN